MIPLRDQEVIRQRFEQELKGRVRIDYFTQRQSKLVIPGRQECLHCEDVRLMLEEIAHLSPRVALTVHELAAAPRAAAELGVDKVPGTVIRGAANRPVRFAGIPAGGQFPGFIDTIIDASSQTVELKAETVRQLKKVKEDVRLQVLVAPVCQHSPGLARLALKLGLHSPRIQVEVIEAVEFPALVERLGIRATPATVLNDKVLLPGAMDEITLLQAILRVAEGNPLSMSDFKPGPVTMLPVPPQEQQRPATTGSGIILPR